MNTIKYRIKTSAEIGDWNYMYFPSKLNSKEDLNEGAEEWLLYIIEGEIVKNFGDITDSEGYRGFDWEFTDDLPQDYIDHELKTTQLKLSYYQDKLLHFKEYNYFKKLNK